MQMAVLYTGAFTKEQMPDPDSERASKIVWKSHFQLHKLTWRQIKEALDHATSDPKSIPWPNLAGFMALVQKFAKTERGLNHASRQPAAQVLTRHTGARAHQLPSETAERKSRRKTVGNAAMAAILADF